MGEGKRRGETGHERLDGWNLQRRELPFRLRLRIPSDRKSIRKAVDKVCRVAVRCGCSEDRQADLEIALREALANAIAHGNRSRPGREVFLRCYAGPKAGILVAVRDQGCGFDPDSVPDPRAADRKHLEHGRGLLLMRELTDGLEFRRGGCEVVLFQDLRS